MNDKELPTLHPHLNSATGLYNWIVQLVCVFRETYFAFFYHYFRLTFDERETFVSGFLFCFPFGTVFLEASTHR